MGFSLYIPFGFSARIDIHRLRAYLARLELESSVEDVHDLQCLRVTLGRGELRLNPPAEVQCFCHIFPDGSAVFSTEISCLLEEAVEDPLRFLTRTLPLTRGEGSTEESFFGAFFLPFLCRLLGAKDSAELAKLRKASRLVPGFREASGVDFFLLGKEDILTGFSGHLLALAEVDELPEGQVVREAGPKVVAKGATLYVEGTATAQLKEDMVSLCQKKAFLERHLLYCLAWETHLARDIHVLKTSTTEKSEIMWDEERDTLELKTLNFLEFVSFVDSRRPAVERQKCRMLNTERMEELLEFERYARSLSQGLARVEQLLAQLNRIIESRQALSVRRATERVEHLLSVLGVLGGVAAVLAVILAGGLSAWARAGAVAALLALPAVFLGAQRKYRALAEKKSKRYYAEAKVRRLRRELQELKQLIESVRADPSLDPALKQEVVRIYSAGLEDLERELEEARE